MLHYSIKYFKTYINKIFKWVKRQIINFWYRKISKSEMKKYSYNLYDSQGFLGNYIKYRGLNMRYFVFWLKLYGILKSVIKDHKITL